MASLVEFLEARIAEDEARARYPYLASHPDPLFSPARALAECAAKRAILDGWEDPDDIGPLDGDVDAGHVLAMDKAVRALAAVYKDHKDYRQEWAA
ncbi:hypothetical protein SEA_BAUER_37 [Arthrobacter phage Bauer]|uniref:Uncharacterized protein n=1 Tax=Arthrobacter phage Bauer TaxID=2985648 RepID=A0A9E8AAE0_9CAUD|nr:hypothetical protein QEO99_gp37 [Arthrobacter phage Bauer]UYM26586.1 hypothetical protein SEA_BAUER_37 [Arthrobacter phage Bauer]